MLKTIATMTALSGLMLSAALAQSTAAHAGIEAHADGNHAGRRQGDDYHGTKARSVARVEFRGADILGPDNEKIGNVSDILFERNGTVMA